MKPETFLFTKGDNVLQVIINQGTSGNFGDSVWPAAKELGTLLWNNIPFVKGKHVIELGCGPGLSGIVAAKCGAHVTFTDKRIPYCILENCKANCDLNGLTDYMIVCHGTLRHI